MAGRDSLNDFQVYQLARQAFEEFWSDSEAVGQDYRGRELVKQQFRSLESICANIEEGYGRGFGKEYPHSLRVARGEARESRGRYERMKRLLPEDIVARRIDTLSRLIGGLTTTIQSLESKHGPQG